MATYEGPKVHVTAELVYTVPAEYRYGACWPEVEKAVVGLLGKLRELGVLKPDEHPTDDLIRIYPADDEVRIVATIQDGIVKDSAKALSLLAGFPGKK
jgi:hypothetical protein